MKNVLRRLLLKKFHDYKVDGKVLWLPAQPQTLRLIPNILGNFGWLINLYICRVMLSPSLKELPHWAVTYYLVYLLFYTCRNNNSGLHTALKHSLSKNSAVALLDIDRLDGRTAMALHSFCDSDATGGEDPNMAPYVHTALLTTLKGF